MGLPQTKNCCLSETRISPGHPIVLFVKSGNLDGCGLWLGDRWTDECMNGIGYRDRTFGTIFSGQGVCLCAYEQWM